MNVRPSFSRKGVAQRDGRPAGPVGRCARRGEPAHSAGRSRTGYTLLELLVSSVSATVLMVGLASALFLAGQALEGRSSAADRARSAETQNALFTDLEHALSFSERMSERLTFTVPDRDGDGFEETLSYAWGEATGGELTLSINSGEPAPLLTGVKSLQLDWSSRSMAPVDPEPPPLDPASWGGRW